MSFELLLEAAEYQIAGIDANDWLWSYRETIEKEHGQSILYEQVIEKENWSTFVTEGISKLLLHLEAKKLHAPVGPYLLIIVWNKATMHVFGAPHYFETLCEIEQVELQQLLRPAQKEQPIMALPAPKPDRRD